jgi:hypothetical protein
MPECESRKGIKRAMPGLDAIERLKRKYLGEYANM